MIGLKQYYKAVFRYPDGKIAVFILCAMVILALMSDFIASEYPIVYKGNNGIEFPILKQYAGTLKHGSNYRMKNEYQSEDHNWAIWPLIRYSPNNIDKIEGVLSNPFTKNHLLGTDEVGRDVASGLVHGSRTSLGVGILAVLLSIIIGITVGMAPGYYGDYKLRVPISSLIILSLSMPFVVFYSVRLVEVFANSSLFQFLFAVLLVAMFYLTLFRYLWPALPENLKKRKVYLPLDILLMRILEIFRALPALYIVLSILILIKNPGSGALVLLIGILFWTTFARYIRAEFLALRERPFISRLVQEGYSDPHIMFGFMLPNTLTPLLILASFAIGSAIILESTLSFLGIGLPVDHISWGSIMNQARSHLGHWWLAVFPGLLILMTVWSFNTIGKRMNEYTREAVNYSS